MKYYIGQIFIGTYPEKAAEWCNDNNAYIDEIEPLDNKRRFEIFAIEAPTPAERKAMFLQDFFKLSLGELGTAYYRKKPKGYQSAIESINTAQIICSKLGGLPAGTMIFYKEPNFNLPEQCTEEWLEANQIMLPALSIEQFDNFYINFVIAWNNQEHL